MRLSKIYSKFSKKLTFLTPSYTYKRMHIRGCEMLVFGNFCACTKWVIPMCSSTLSSSTVCTISLLKYHFVCPAFGSESSLFLTQFHNSFPSYIPVAQISASQILFFMVFFIYVMAYTLVYFFSEFFSRI